MDGSLSYASRAKNIVNKENKKTIETDQIKKLKTHIDQLKQQLKSKHTSPPVHKP
jgi:hypothetical protein